MRYDTYRLTFLNDSVDNLGQEAASWPVGLTDLHPNHFVEISLDVGENPSDLIGSGGVHICLNYNVHADSNSLAVLESCVSG
jgi:hypothetical protein